MGHLLHSNRMHKRLDKRVGQFKRGGRLITQNSITRVVHICTCRPQEGSRCRAAAGGARVESVAVFARLECRRRAARVRRHRQRAVRLARTLSRLRFSCLSISISRRTAHSRRYSHYSFSTAHTFSSRSDMSFELSETLIWSSRSMYIL